MSQPPKKTFLQKASKKLGRGFKSLDMLGHRIEFNIEGQTKIQSKLGTCVTIMLATIFLLYSLIRAQQLAFREDVEVTRIELINALDSSNIFHFDDINFTMAFGVTGYFDGSNKDDPEYVEWVVNFEKKLGLNESAEPIGIHRCTEEDYAKFHPVIKAQQSQLAELKRRQSLYCMDKGTNLTIFGNNDYTDYRRFDAKLMPCRPDPAKNKTCSKTLEETIEYIHPSQLVVYYNAPRFDQQVFDGNHILYESKILNIQFDSYIPNFFNSKIVETEINDEIDWINIGMETVNYFYTPIFGQQQSSAWTEYPNAYRITGFELLINPDMVQFSRRAFDLLGWLGDVGGLLQGLGWIGFLIISTYYAPSNANGFVVSKLFRQVSTEFKEKKLNQIFKLKFVQYFCKGFNYKKVLINNIVLDFDTREKIPRWDFFRDVLNICHKKKSNEEQTQTDFQRRRRLLVRKGMKELGKELDIIKILQQMRLLNLIFRATYNKSDRDVLEKVTKRVLSSNTESSSSDEDPIKRQDSKLQDSKLQATPWYVQRKNSLVMSRRFDNDIDDRLTFQQRLEQMVDKDEKVYQNLIQIWKDTDTHRLVRWQNKFLSKGCADFKKAQSALKSTLWTQMDNQDVKSNDKVSNSYIQDIENRLEGQQGYQNRRSTNLIEPFADDPSFLLDGTFDFYENPSPEPLKKMMNPTEISDASNKLFAGRVQAAMRQKMNRRITMKHTKEEQVQLTFRQRSQD